MRKLDRFCPYLVCGMKFTMSAVVFPGLNSIFVLMRKMVSSVHILDAVSNLASLQNCARFGQHKCIHAGTGRILSVSYRGSLNREGPRMEFSWAGAEYFRVFLNILFNLARGHH